MQQKQRIHFFGDITALPDFISTAFAGHTRSHARQATQDDGITDGFKDKKRSSGLLIKPGMYFFSRLVSDEFARTKSETERLSAQSPIISAVVFLPRRIAARKRGTSSGEYPVIFSAV